MYQIFQMRYFRAFQAKGLQSYRPSEFPQSGNEPKHYTGIAILEWNAESDQVILVTFDC